MKEQEIEALVQTLDKAALDKRATAQLSKKHSISPEDAYVIQERLVERRVGRGEKLIGYKMGLTSRAKMIQMGVDQMAWGRLTDAMLVEDGGEIDIKDYVHPRVEPELAFLIGKPLEGRVSMAAAMATVEAIAPAMEIIDSRYKDFKFDLADVIADNSSSAGLVIGPWSHPDWDYRNLGVIMEFDGAPVQIGSTAAILGHPARVLVTIARMLTGAGRRLEPGMVVMAGAATAAERLRPGLSVRNVVESLGSASFRVAP